MYGGPVKATLPSLNLRNLPSQDYSSVGGETLAGKKYAPKEAIHTRHCPVGFQGLAGKEPQPPPVRRGYGFAAPPSDAVALTARNNKSSHGNKYPLASGANPHGDTGIPFSHPSTNYSGNGVSNAGGALTARPPTTDRANSHLRQGQGRPTQSVPGAVVDDELPMTSAKVRSLIMVT